MRRIESGIHGPTLVLSDKFEDRAEWDDIELHCHKDRDGVLRITAYKAGEKVLNHRLHNVRGVPQEGWAQ